MKLLPATAIVIKANRQRQEFTPTEMNDLMNSIQTTGLMQAIVVREEEGKTVLVAGERRLRAISDLWALGGSFKYNNTDVPEGWFPTVTMGELSELEAEEAELDENLKRKDLTWQEQSAALARLHELRVNQSVAAQAVSLKSVETGRVPRVQTLADTAQEVFGRRDGSYQDTIRTATLLSKHLDNPLIAKAGSAKEALKILKAEEQKASNIALAAKIGETFSANDHLLLNVNCLDWMAGCVPETFDVICTDPPYGMGADSFGDGGGKMTGITHEYSDTYESWQILMTAWCPLAYAVAKPQAHAYVFCDFDRFHELKLYMENAGWYVFRTPLIVHKLNSGRVPLPDQGPRRQWEMILYAIKGKKPVTHIYPDVIPCQADENMTHGAQKPVALMLDLLKRSVRPGDRVLDCFAGTGPVIEAGHTLKCAVTALEQSKASYGIALQRFQSLQAADTDLFRGLA